MKEGQIPESECQTSWRQDDAGEWHWIGCQEPRHGCQTWLKQKLLNRQLDEEQKRLEAEQLSREPTSEWIALVLEGKQTREGRELAGLGNEANCAISSEMACQQMLREALQGQETLRVAEEQAISSASQSSQTVIDDFGRRNQELENYLNQESHQLSQERQSFLSCRMENKVRIFELRNEVGAETKPFSRVNKFLFLHHLRWKFLKE